MQPNEQSDELNLLDLPHEMLEHILIHLEDEDLLTASHVCKLLASTVETAFGLKYANRDYSIESKSTHFHEVMLTKYGEKIRKFWAYDIDEALLDVIERKCCNLTHATFYCVPKLPMLNNLKEFKGRFVLEWNRNTLIKFINDNAQLEFLLIGNVPTDFTDVLNGRLNMLKRLELSPTGARFAFSQIRLPSLETLRLICCEFMDIDRLLRVMNCNSNITKLIIVHCNQSYDTVISGICTLKSIVELQLTFWEITNDQIKKLAAHLPHLTELSFKMAGHGPELKRNIRMFLSLFPNLKKLSIESNENDIRQILSHFQESAAIYDFHASFDRFDTEIEITLYGERVVSLTKDRILARKPTINSLELHWMNNLNAAKLRKVNECSWINKFKLVNHCEEHTVDIATFMASKFECVEWFVIESIGPVTVNANVGEIILSFLSNSTVSNVQC